MKPVLYEYDIFPMVFPIERAVEFTVKPLGVHRAFSGEYKIVVHRMNAGSAGPDASFARTDRSRSARRGMTSPQGALLTSLTSLRRRVPKTSIS